MTYDQYTEAKNTIDAYVVDLTHCLALARERARQAESDRAMMYDYVKEETRRHGETRAELADARAEYDRLTQVTVMKFAYNELDDTYRKEVAAHHATSERLRVVEEEMNDLIKEVLELAKYKGRVKVWLEGHLERHPECMTDFVKTVLLA